ncbi:hypothetical protein NDU88_005929 [Pleurodeles waltl]|uniref:Uncharacterized protein n=1 Tax=Pleurodeles waltl TaxID=8319 RepID=A0AAV7WCU0_PLEWA|nr:hypothetical protein NDU88_005929 [Pleurodeles waltl]
MDQYTAQSSGEGLQKDPPNALEKGAEPTGAQILAAIESLRHAMQTQIAAIAVDVNLLRADLRVVAKRSVATEKQVMCLQSEMDTLKASVAILEAKTHKLEARVEDVEDGREICLLNIYAPNTDDVGFYHQIQQELISYTGIPILWASDFNCVLHGALDRHPPEDEYENAYDFQTAERYEEYPLC